MSLRAKTRIILAIAAIVPAVVIGGLSIYRANTVVESEVIRGRLAQVRALAASLDETVQGARRSLELAAAWWADNRTIDETASAESQQVMNRLWRRLQRELPMFSALSILDTKGNTIFGEPIASDSNLGAHSFGGFVGDVIRSETSSNERPTGLERHEAGFLLHSEAVLQKSGVGLGTWSGENQTFVPIVTQARSRTGERIGVLVARLDLSFVANAISEVPLGENARLLVFDGNGAIIARTDQNANDAADVDLEAIAQVALGRASEGQLRESGRLAIYRNLVAYQTRRALPWVLLLDQPEADAFAMARRATMDTLIVALIVLLLAIVLGAIVANRVTRPLHLLSKRADAIAEGQASEQAPVEAPGEIGVLARRIEEMAIKIDERERLQSALAHEDRLATVGTMAASVAHEINNPLTTILGYSSLLQEDKSEDDPDRKSLALIEEEASRMKQIVGSMLEYSRRAPTRDKESLCPGTSSVQGEPSRGSSADLVPLMERVATLMRPAMKKAKVQLDVDIEKGFPRLAASEQSLQQVLVNLVQNAAQACPEKARVVVRARQEDGKGVILVEDEGPGIAPTDREKIFEAFFTTKKAGQGTGLGLAVVKHLVGEFSGKVAVVEPTTGKGTCMRLEIPIEPA
jgi:signal transduction histidine kinase